QALFFAGNVAPIIHTQPTSTTKSEGTAATFSVTAVGNATITYQWRKGITVLGGQTASTLTLNNVAPGDAGSYNVVVANSFGSVTSAPATLTVISGPPILFTDIAPLTQTNFLGMPTTFTVNAGGTLPITYYWYRDGSVVQSGSSASYTFGTLSGTHTYSCTISNSFGSTNSSTASVSSRFTD